MNRRVTLIAMATAAIICMGCVAVISWGYLWLTGGGPYETPTPHFYVTGVHLTTAVDGNGFPVDQVDGYPEGTSEAIICLAGNAGVPVVFTARWFHNGEFLAENSRPVTTYAGCLSYHPDPPGPLPPGTYSVEVYVDGELERTVEFAVGR